MTATTYIIAATPRSGSSLLAEGLAAIGLKTSKRGGFAKPLAKTYSGLFEQFSPRD